MERIVEEFGGMLFCEAVTLFLTGMVMGFMKNGGVLYGAVCAYMCTLAG